MTRAIFPIHWSKAKRRRDWAMRKAKRLHAALIEALGGKCVWCGETGENHALTIDHPNGRKVPNSVTNNMRWDKRVMLYWEEYREGIPLQVLCAPCNSKDGRRRQMEHEAEQELIKALPTPPF